MTLLPVWVNPLLPSDGTRVQAASSSSWMTQHLKPGEPLLWHSMAMQVFGWLRSLIGAAFAVFVLLAPPAFAQVCGAPGADGPVTIAGAGNVVNTYHTPSSTTLAAGATSVGINAGSGANVNIAVGDKLLIMQMQGATYNATNGGAYGDGSSGSGVTSLNGVGKYEYVRVTSVSSATSFAGGATVGVQGGSGAGTINAYSNTGTNRYQVIRVPQYSAVTITGTLQPSRWDGARGGVVVIDVAGTLTFNGGTISAAGLGFRGAQGRQLGGDGALAATDFCAITTANTFGAKGEGIAGQPRDMLDQTTGAADAAGLDNYACGAFTTGRQQGRGAPGNAGGGGTDANPGGNDQNTGGGGGGGLGDGGIGGNAWFAAATRGGLGGRGVAQTVSLLTQGGGGGAGTRNNSAGVQSSGAAGGGIVLVRANRIDVTGSGTINVSGASGDVFVPDNDGGGGGGGGGAIMVYAAQSGSGTPTFTANGGAGSRAWPTAGGAGAEHGPGGGGGGGFIAWSGGTLTPTTSVTGGVNGTTLNTLQVYGAGSGNAGGTSTTVAPAGIPGIREGAACYPVITVEKRTVASQPVQVAPGGTVRYRITATNATGVGDARGLSLADTLPGSPAWQYQSTPVVSLLGGATRPTTTNPALNATAPVWSSFTLPAGASVALDVDVLVPLGNAVGTYQNPATTTYLDPTRTAGATTVTPGGTYTAGGTVPGANYSSGSSALEDVQVVSAGALVVTKAFSPVFDNVGAFNSTLTITITNSGGTVVTGAAFVDNYPDFAGGNRLDNTGVLPTVTNCGAGAAVTLLTDVAGGNSDGLQLAGGNLAPGATCTISVPVLANGNRTWLNTVNVSAIGVATASASATFISGSSVNAPLRLTKTITPGTIARGANATLSVVVNNDALATTLTAALVDTFPAGMTTTAGSFITNTCGWTSTATSLTLPNATPIGAGGSCTVTILVTAAAAGAYVNTIGPASAAGKANSNIAAATLHALAPPTVTKSFAPSTIAAGGRSTMTVTVSNPSTNTAFLPAVAINDAYTAGMTNALAGSVSCFTNTGVATAGAGVVLTGGAVSGTAVGFNSASIQPGGYCTITQVVTATSTNVNTTTAPSSTINGVTINGTAAAATLTVTPLLPPTVTKSFAAAGIGPNGTTTLTITLNNPNPATAGALVLSAAFTDNFPTSPAPMVIASGASLSTSCGGAVSSSAVNVSPGFVTLASGSTIPAGGCTISVDVKVTGGTGTDVNTIPAGALQTNGGNNADPATANLIIASPPGISKSFSPSIIAAGGTSTLTINLTSPSGASISGVSVIDSLPTGVDIAVTPAITNSCGGAVTAYAGTTPRRLELLGATIPPAGCSFGVNVTAAANGIYDNKIRQSDVATAVGLPNVLFYDISGPPTSGVVAFAQLNVGGAQIAGRVFRDTGSGGGTANDGVLGAGEGSALAGVIITLSNCSGTTLATTVTDGAGGYSFAPPNTATTLCVAQSRTADLLATGASVAPPSASVVPLQSGVTTSAAGVNYLYCRATTDAGCGAQPAESIRFTFAAGTTYSDLNFGNVPRNLFVADGAQQAPTGSVVFYPHVFTPGTGGTVSFSATVAGTSPAIGGWSELLYRDDNCNGTLEAGETTLLTPAVSITTTAGQNVCAVLKVFTPPAAPSGALRVSTVTASFTYTGTTTALPVATLQRTDTTTVGEKGDGLRLRKEVCNLTVQAALASPCDPLLTGATAGNGFSTSNSGKPGEDLQYRIIYVNQSAQPLSNLVINDTTPPFTVRDAVAAACPVVPAGLSPCSITEPLAGAAGAIRWSFPATVPVPNPVLNPGASGVVTFTVTIQ